MRGILGDLEVNNPSAVEAEHNRGIDEPERRGGNHKHVDRRNVGQVVAQKGPHFIGACRSWAMTVAVGGMHSAGIPKEKNSGPAIRKLSTVGLSIDA